MLLYIHLPFCRSRCAYCDFYSTVPEDQQCIYRYIDALALEWKLRGCSSTVIETVFVGGGTPSLLTGDAWQYLADKLFSMCQVQRGAEWTVECNPESFSDETATCFITTGVTRVTFGVQTLDKRVRRVLKRCPDTEVIDRVLGGDLLKEFRSVGVDLMYGLPGQTADSFRSTLLNIVRRSSVHHLSVYELTIADTTPFGRHKRLLPLPSEDEIQRMTLELNSVTDSHGFIRYEVSNFARPGHECAHNKGYWNHVPYIGLGSSAHSYMDGKRWWNIADRERYCMLLERGVLPTEREEVIDGATMAREMLFLGFRQTCGLNENVFRENVGSEFTRWVDSEVLDRLVKNGLICYESPWWKPTEKGLLYADYCARELF